MAGSPQCIRWWYFMVNLWKTPSHLFSISQTIIITILKGVYYVPSDIGRLHLSETLLFKRLLRWLGILLSFSGFARQREGDTVVIHILCVMIGLSKPSFELFAVSGLKDDCCCSLQCGTHIIGLSCDAQGECSFLWTSIMSDWARIGNSWDMTSEKTSWGWKDQTIFSLLMNSMVTDHKPSHIHMSIVRHDSETDTDK